MRKKINKKPFILAAAAFVLTGTLAVESTIAYFTTYATAEGTVRMDIGFTETVVEDRVDEGIKYVAIRNTGDYDCFVRVRLFSPVALTYQPGGGWVQDGDYWYYNDVLQANTPENSVTSELLAQIEFPKNTDEDKTEEFNIIVVHECTPAVYDEAGNPAPDWKNVIASDSEQ